MSTKEQTRAYSDENSACKLDSSTSQKPHKPENLDPDELYKKYLNRNAKQASSTSNDDFERRFMEQLYKERDNSEGWDKYFQMLHDGLRNDDEVSSSDDQNQCKSSVNLKNVDCSRTNSNDKVHKCYSPKVTLSNDKLKYEMSETKQKQKDVHYFRNGTCYYGDPSKDRKRTEKVNKQKESLKPDVSELQFYRNLRAYFGASREKTNKTNSPQKTTEGEIPPNVKECKQSYEHKGTPKKPKSSTDVLFENQNGLPSKEGEDGKSRVRRKTVENVSGLHGSSILLSSPNDVEQNGVCSHEGEERQTLDSRIGSKNLQHQTSELPSHTMPSEQSVTNKDSFGKSKEMQKEEKIFSDEKIEEPRLSYGLHSDTKPHTQGEGTKECPTNVKGTKMNKEGKTVHKENSEKSFASHDQGCFEENDKDWKSSEETFGNKEKLCHQIPVRTAFDNEPTECLSEEKASSKTFMGSQTTWASGSQCYPCSSSKIVEECLTRSLNKCHSTEKDQNYGCTSSKESPSSPVDQEDESSKEDTSASSIRGERPSVGNIEEFQQDSSQIDDSKDKSRTTLPKSSSSGKDHSTKSTDCDAKSNISDTTQEKTKREHVDRERSSHNGGECIDGKDKHRPKWDHGRTSTECDAKSNIADTTQGKTKSEHVDRERSSHNGGEFVDGKDKHIPKWEKASDCGQPTVNDKPYRKAKKSHKTREGSSQNSHRSSSSSSFHSNRRPHQPRREFVRQPRDDMVINIPVNEPLGSLMWRFLHSVKGIAVFILKVLMWIAYSHALVALVLGSCLLAVLKGAVLSVNEYVMSLGVTITIIEKIWLCKVYVSRWYSEAKEYLLEKIKGPKRAAQTYNLPNTGNEAVEQLLMRKGPDDNPYRILGVPKDAIDEDIRKQYRKFAVLVHPDKNKHPHAGEAFRILSSAYDILGDPEKRHQYDRELARQEQTKRERANGNFMRPPSDYKNPEDFFADFMKQMEEIRESLSCNVCGGRHRRKPVDRSVNQARFCSECCVRHLAREGDFWKEGSFLGIGPGKFYTRMDNMIYDITDWGLCQERRGFRLEPDSHRVQGKISTNRQQPPPRQSYTEEDFFRDIFGRHDEFDNRHRSTHGHREQHKNKQKRRRKRK